MTPINSDGDFEMPDHWTHTETSMYVETFGGSYELVGDETLQLLFHESLFDMDLDPNTREAIKDQLDQYLWDQYDISFDDVFDWAEYREWYG